MRFGPGDHPQARWLGLAGLIGLISIMTVTMWRPHLIGIVVGPCAFLDLTGHPCPTCGATRAITALAHGRLIDAVAANPLAVTVVVLLGLGGLVGLVTTLRPRWRRRLSLAPGEVRWWWAAATLLVTANWLYLEFAQ